ncbi:MAG: DUF5719 family protein [Thermoanaerobaculia bacterium]
MSIKSLMGRLLAAGLLLAMPLPAQTPTTIPSGQLHATENSRPVSGVRVEARPDGSVWFLLPTNDRIVQLSGTTMRQWQIRPDRNIGANPVDFEIDGDFVWFIETGQSQIDSNESILGRLDTRNGALREWVVPGSRPAGFIRDGENRVWLPQTDRRIQLLELDTLRVVDYRSLLTVAYSDVVMGPDGALWLADFGNNRIVRWEPGAATETSWTMVDPFLGLLNTTQIEFDALGRLWMSQFDGLSMDRFDPGTGELRIFTGFARPIHFDFFNGRLYVAEATGANGTVAVLDPAIASSSTRTLTPATIDVGESVNRRRAEVRDSAVSPTTFSTTADAIPEADLVVTSTVPGILRTQFPSRNAYGIDVVGGTIWVGSEGRLARLLLQTIGAPADLAVPVASQFSGPEDSQIRVEITLHNRGTQPITGEALYLFSPASFASRETFTLAPGGTRVIRDAFRGASSQALVFGPVRFRVTAGAAGDLATSVRTVRTRPDGAGFGYAIPARTGAESLGEGVTRTLFTGSRATDISIFGFFSPTGAQATATLVAPDGSVRGSHEILVVANVAQEFNPASSAFGVAPQPGDVIRVSVASGTLQPYVHVFQPSSTDVAAALPAAAGLESFFPNAGSFPGEERSFFSDFLLSNPGNAPASLTVRFFPLGSTSPIARSVLLPAGSSLVYEDALPSLFGVPSGQGAIAISSDAPVAAALRVMSRQPDGDYSGFAPALQAEESVSSDGSSLAFGLQQNGSRRSHLLLFNAGSEGVATVIGFDGAGSEVGRLDVPLAAGEAARVNSVFNALGSGEMPGGSIRVAAAAGMRLFAQAAELDNVTSDPEYAKLE